MPDQREAGSRGHVRPHAGTFGAFAAIPPNTTKYLQIDRFWPFRGDHFTI
jgi:hypothetical protein